MLSKLHYDEVESADAGMGSTATSIRWLIDAKRGAGNFFMRMFEVEEGGMTPLHSHDWEHEIFVLEGKGVLSDGVNDIPLYPWDFSFVPANETHQFRNAGKLPFKFLCLIPNKDAKPNAGSAAQKTPGKVPPPKIVGGGGGC